MLEIRAIYNYTVLDGMQKFSLNERPKLFIRWSSYGIKEIGVLMEHFTKPLREGYLVTFHKVKKI